MCDSTKENDAPMTAVIAELQALTQKNTQQMEALLAAFPQLQPREVPAIEASAIEAPAFEAPPTPLSPLAIEPAPEEPVFDEAAATEAAKKLNVVELCAALEAAGRPVEILVLVTRKGSGSGRGQKLALVSRLVEAKRAAAMAAARPQIEPVLDAELAPPPSAASTPEPPGAQAQEMQLVFDNNKIYVAYHEVVPGKTIDDLKALFPTDEEWEVFAAGAATYLPKQVWDAFLDHPDSVIDYYDAISKAEEEKMIKSQEMVPPLCRDEAGAKKLKANYERVLAKFPALTTVLTFKMDEEKKVLAAFKTEVPTLPLAWRRAAADALAPTTPRSLAKDTGLQSLTPLAKQTELAIADERRARKMEIEDLKSQLRDSQEKAELAVARGENMTMKILDLQKLADQNSRYEARLEKQLEKTRAERDAAREDAQKKTATIAERDERIALVNKCVIKSLTPWIKQQGPSPPSA